MIAFLFTVAASVFYFGFGHPFRTPKIIVLAVLLTVLAYRHRQRLQVDLAGVLLFGWPLITLWWVVNPVLFFGAIAVWALYAQAFASAYPISEREGDAVREGLAWSGMAVAVYGLAQRVGLDFVSIDPADSGGGFFGNPNFAAHFMLLGLCLGKWRGKNLQRLGIALLLAGLLVSQSRGAWLGLILFWLLRRDRLPHPLGKALPLVLGLSLILFVSIFFRDLSQGWRYLRHPQDYIAEYRREPEKPENRSPWFRGKRFSLMTRWILYRNGLEMVKAHGLLGVGPGQFHIHYPKFAQAAIPDINLNKKYRAVSAHSLPLDAAIQLGIPWLLLAGWWLWRRYRQTSGEKDFWAALAAQGMVALFSLNYLNPVIVTTLILLAPQPPHFLPVRGKNGFWVSLALAGIVALLGWLDYRAGRAEKVEGPGELSVLFPQARARLLVRAGDLSSAWHAQFPAFQSDPFGPETIYNMGVVAWVLGGIERDEGLRRLAVRAFLVNRQMHPFYEPAALRLRSIEAEGGFEATLRAEDGGDYRVFRRLLEWKNLCRATRSRTLANP